MTLFALAADPDSVFEEVLAKYFGGGQDRLTLDLLGLGIEGSRYERTTGLRRTALRHSPRRVLRVDGTARAQADARLSPRRRPLAVGRRDLGGEPGARPLLCAHHHRGRAVDGALPHQRMPAVLDPGALVEYLIGTDPRSLIAPLGEALEHFPSENPLRMSEPQPTVPRRQMELWD